MRPRRRSPDKCADLTGCPDGTQVRPLRRVKMLNCVHTASREAAFRMAQRGKHLCCRRPAPVSLPDLSLLPPTVGPAVLRAEAVRGLRPARQRNDQAARRALQRHLPGAPRARSRDWDALAQASIDSNPSAGAGDSISRASNRRSARRRAA